MARLARAVLGRAKDESGSILIAALVLTFVLTLLGLALFELAVLDSRLALGTEADYRALELANSAVERTLYRLLLDLCGGSASCTAPPSGVSWADGTIDSMSFGPTTGTNFVNFIASTTALNGSFAGQNYTGTYSVDLRNLTVAQAGSLGLTCTADAASNCQDLIHVRSTGNFTAGDVASVTRTVQVIVKGMFNGLGEGFRVAGPAEDQIQGNTDLHGSLHIIPCGTAPTCNQVRFSGNSGIRNNYNGMPSSLQNIIPLLPLVTCPPGTPCAGSSVETLGAWLRIAYPRTSAAVNIASPSATIGESGSGGTNSYTGIVGKPTMDGVFIGDGCQSSDCSDTVANHPGNVYSDVPIKEYDQNPRPKFPSLDDKVQVFARNYDDYAACSGPGACNASGAVVTGTGNDFFISHAFKILSTTMEDTDGCLMPPCTSNLLTLLSTGDWTDSTPTWRLTLTCVTGVPVGNQANCDDADGKRLNGSVVTVASGAQTKPVAFQLEWRGSDWPAAVERNTLVVYQCPLSCAVLKIPFVVSNVATENAFPVMIYVDGDLRICEGCNNKEFYYVGNAVILAKGTGDDTVATNNPSIALDPSFLGCARPCTVVDHDSFPKRNLMTFYTPGNIMMGLRSNRDMMGVFYAGGKWQTSKQTNVVGGITARLFDITSNVPSLWQATTPRIQVAFPTPGQRWNVTVARWKECAGAVPAGPC